MERARLGDSASVVLARPRLAAAFASLAVLVMWCAPAGASGPKLTVAKADLAAAFKCPIDPTDATTTPLMFVTGTGATGEQGYLIGQDAFEAYGHPVCYVNFPDFTTADIQVSVQYLVYALRREYARAGRKIAVFGISQGGLLPRFALTYWPDLRHKVSDVLSAAGTHHGTTCFGAARTRARARRPTGSRSKAPSCLTRSMRSPMRRRATSRTRRSARLPTRPSSPRQASARPRPSRARATSSSSTCVPVEPPPTSARRSTRLRSLRSSTRSSTGAWARKGLRRSHGSRATYAITPTRAASTRRKRRRS
jgi:hypothetical protein